MRFTLVARTGHPDFLDLPWQTPLREWDSDRLVEVPRGIHRNVVRTVEYDDRRYFLKSLPTRLVEREWRLLRALAAANVPVVDVVGIVKGRRTEDGEPLNSILITAQLEYALPYRLLFARRDSRELREPMIDALVDLLVRVHLVGFRWGDCSLSNTLFRRDAGRLAAFVVDTETGELHPDGLSDGQRRSDIEFAVERIVGELLDLMAAGLVSEDTDVVELAEQLTARYELLWTELTEPVVVAQDEHYRIHDRLRRLNELGYDVEELQIDLQDDGRYRLHLSPRVIEPGHYRRRLLELTRLVAQEQQARSLLRDVDSFGAWLREFEGVDYSEQYVASRWLEHSFGGVIERVPEGLRGTREPTELFHEALKYWLAKCKAEDRDLDLFETTERFVDEVLARAPEERSPTIESQREADLMAADDLPASAGSPTDLEVPPTRRRPV